jgi:hypothetical protein
MGATYTDWDPLENFPVITSCCKRLEAELDTTTCACGRGDDGQCEAIVCRDYCPGTVSCETQGHNQDPILRDHAYRHVCGVSDTLYLCQHCQTQWESQ